MDSLRKVNLLHICFPNGGSITSILLFILSTLQRTYQSTIRSNQNHTSRGPSNLQLPVPKSLHNFIDTFFPSTFYQRSYKSTQNVFVFNSFYLIKNNFLRIHSILLVGISVLNRTLTRPELFQIFLIDQVKQLNLPQMRSRVVLFTT